MQQELRQVRKGRRLHDRQGLQLMQEQGRHQVRDLPQLTPRRLQPDQGMPTLQQERRLRLLRLQMLSSV